MLLNLDKLLNNKVNIIWVVYHELVKTELIKNGVKKSQIEFIDLNFPFIKKPLLLKKIINRILYLVFKEKALNFFLAIACSKLYKKYSPKLWISDTAGFLSKITLPSQKMVIFHSVPYKKFYLSPYTINYDFICFPGSYHMNRFKNYYNNYDLSKKKMKMIGNLNIANFVNNKSLTNEVKYNLLNDYNLNPDWPLLIYAPTYDAFEGDQFFPNSFGDQYNALNNFAKFLNKNKYNLLIKFHHYMHSNFQNNSINKILTNPNVAIYNTLKDHDTYEGRADDLLRACDIILGETSGLLTTAAYLNKKIIFIEPSNKHIWDEVDMDKTLRPGLICKTYDELIQASLTYFNEDTFVDERANFVNKVFLSPNQNAYNKLEKIIIDYL